MIRNVIFDVGNVFVRWSPAIVVERAFGAPAGSKENAALIGRIFGEAWLDLNRGLMAMAEAMEKIAAAGRFSADEIGRVNHHITDHLIAIDGTEALARRIKAAGYRTFALTDNVHEIVAHLKGRHAFWPLFEDVANSAEIGVLKPDPSIYRYLIDRHRLAPSECIFMDDVARNVEGARAAGMAAFVFHDAAQAETALRAAGLTF